MYIIEIIAKLIKNHKKKKEFSQDNTLEEDFEVCNHIYLAIDSSKDYLACNKCGDVIKNKHKNIKKNIFNQ